MGREGELHMIRSAIVGLAFASLAACSPKVITRDVPIEVKVPVAQPCAGERPAPPAPLASSFPNWPAMDVKQKAAAVGKQALEWQAYGQQLNAATAACP